MKEKLLEKEASVKKRDPVESSIKKVCRLALQEENERLKQENQLLRAHISLLEDNERLRAQAALVPVTVVARQVRQLQEICMEVLHAKAWSACERPG